MSPRVLTEADVIGQLVRSLTSRGFVVQNEADLQRGVEQVLREDSYTFESQVELGSRKDRIDLMVNIGGGRGVGIELKVKGAHNEVVRQLYRYALSERVSALILVTTRSKHLRGMPLYLNDKPLRIVHLGGL